MVGTTLKAARVASLVFLTLGCGESHGDDEPPADLGPVRDLGSERDLGGAVDLGGEGSDLGDTGCDACISEPPTWQWEGGFVAFRDRYEWASCATVVKTREDFGTGGGITTLCELDVGALDCGAANAVADALAAPGLDAARSAAPVLYGFDSRPADGVVFRIDLGGDVIDVGGECGDRDGCTPVPEAVDALRDALMAAMSVVDGAAECAP